MIAMYSIVAIANSIVANNNRINVISNNGVIIYINIVVVIIIGVNNIINSSNINSGVNIITGYYLYNCNWGHPLQGCTCSYRVAVARVM